MHQTVVEKEDGYMERLLKDKKVCALLKDGDLAKGVVMEKRPKKLFVDLGAYGTGLVYGVEYLNANDLIKTLEVGAEVVGKVIDPENDAGYIELSLKEAGKQKGWDMIQDVHAKDEKFEASITGYNRGGLVADVFGIAGFMPVSQLSNEHYPRVGADQQKILEALRQFVGKTLAVKILSFNQKSNKLVISERAVAESDLRALVATYRIGDVIDGIVSGVTDFGAFVRFSDNSELEGLVHLSEIDHRLIDTPRSVLNVSDLVKAKIVDIRDSKISLSLKQLKENPWDKVLERFTEGQEIAGEVIKFNPFGALVKLDADFSGLIHVSEFGGFDEMKGTLEVGVSYPFIIKSIRPEDKRIVLVRKKEAIENQEGGVVQDADATKKTNIEAPTEDGQDAAPAA
ncbi:MAG: hypothetical protein A2939_03665 [Parcubacteria group bacterium RIFCSPLOWO2_01_FULL_48_18]|nr:MAG: hypothetical protein A3J67_02605 [Parcubacteria group bacterium RIFCSPHIGHO2_02_FULL_48_10b]OHB22375.1 MAG: hypothetical protein A2939_03665 [Parcubacteria group bacterium RIFCSPLOWO2_01_FULL_48_18]